jgi:ferredoxin
MMAAMRELLGRLGVPAAAIHTEAFVSPPASSDAAPSVSDAALLSAAAQETEPAAADGRGLPARSLFPGATMQVQFRRSRQQVTTPAGQTILETAEAAGLDLAFECRSGICGQCKVRLLAGRVTMEFEDALLASEKAAGLILACQARPTDDVTIDA